MSKVGFIGLGVMGLPMAQHLLDAGNELFVYEKSGKAKEVTAKGAVACGSYKEIAEKADVVILIVPNTPQVEETLFGDDGVEEGISSGKLVIDMSSISPLATRVFAERLGEKGVDYLDAPVSGGEVGAKAASLTIMIGGPDKAFERATPLFEKMGKNITHIGPNGSGQTAKVANQIIVALNIAAVGEALLFASKAGADPAVVRKALLGGFASSRVLEVHGERMLNRTFDPGFRINLHHKDLGIALGEADEMGLSLPQTAACQQLFNAMQGAGEGGLDHSGVVRALERLASHTLE